MTEAVLPGSGRRTSRLGFGASRLSGGRESAESFAVLEAAFEAGIRHFDVAPLYGLGEAEGVLGQFLAGRHNQVTITTKYGLRPPRARSVLSLAKGIVKPIATRLPGLKGGLIRSLAAVTPPPRYSPQELTASLETSLRALRRECIEIFLLHEADESDLTDELRSALNGAVRRGLVGTWGIGGERAKIDRIVTTTLGGVAVFQFEWSVLSERPPVYPGAFVVTYQSLAGALHTLQAALAEPSRRHAWSDAVGLDFNDRWTLPRLMLGAALAANPQGIVLFSSKRPEHIRENVLVLHGGLEVQIQRFVELIRAGNESGVP